jgi:hypothetical protein
MLGLEIDTTQTYTAYKLRCIRLVTREQALCKKLVKLATIQAFPTFLGSQDASENEDDERACIFNMPDGMHATCASQEKSLRVVDRRLMICHRHTVSLYLSKAMLNCVMIQQPPQAEWSS